MATTTFFSSDLPDIINKKIDLDPPVAPKRSTFPRMNNRFTQFFNTAPRKRPETTGKADSSELVDEAIPTIPNSPPSSVLSLPSISLSTATGEKAVQDDQPRLLFEPPSREEEEKI